MTTSILFILLSCVLLTAGADALVRGASATGLRFGIRPLVVGLTIVAFGTSAPELAVSLKAALAGSPHIAAGNIVGSNIFNVAVILAIASLVRPLQVHLQVVRFDTPLMCGVSLLFVALLLSGGQLGRLEGGILFAGIIAYTVHSIGAARKEGIPADTAVAESGAVPTRPYPLWLCALLVAAGLATLVLGARLLVEHAIVLARALKVSEAVIGLTIVAAGTSLPELATSVVASLRRQTDIAVGNIVGSNIFNILCIGGATGLVAPPIPADSVRAADLIWMLALSLVLLPLLRTGFSLQRWEGALLLAGYAVYLAMLWPK